MGAYLKCSICGQKILVDPYCVCPLGEHFIQEHPEEGINFYANDNQCVAGCEERNASETTQRTCTRKDCPQLRRSVFKTTVETWKTGPMKIRCPNCEVEDKPCIRRQRNKIAHTAIGAFCMTTCWPLCFMPFLMPESSVLDLYCKRCGFYLGEYNRKTGTLMCKCDNPGKLLHQVPCQ